MATMSATHQGFDCVDYETYGDVFHVYPQFGREHDTSGDAMCWCYPVVEEYANGNSVVIHSAEH